MTVYQFPKKIKKVVDIHKVKTSRIIVEVDYDPKEDYMLIDFKRRLRIINEGMYIKERSLQVSLIHS